MKNESVVSSQASALDGKIRVGLIGGGGISKIHRRAIATLPWAKIVGIADSHLIRAKEAATELQAVAYTDAEVMIREQKPDVVHVLTPPESHAELAVMAMKQGCHVLVEKPLALNAADARSMFRVAEQNGVKLCVDHNFVLANVFRRAIAMARAGVVGDIVSVDAFYRYDARRNPAVLEDGAEHCYWAYRLNGGPIQDLVPHPASLVMELVGDVDEVLHLGHNRGVLPVGWHDEIRILLKSEKTIGTIAVSLSEKPDVLSFMVSGTEGMIRANVFDNSLIVQRKSDVPRAIARGVAGFQASYQYLKAAIANLYDIATGRFDTSSGVRFLVEEFYRSIREGREVPVAQDRILRVVDVIERVWPLPAPARPPRSTPSQSKTAPRRASALVTGASGFLGIHLVTRLLAEGINVRALVRPNSVHAGRLRHLAVEVFEGDLSDSEAVLNAAEGIKTIYHLGAAMTGSWQDNLNTTVKGTEHVVRAALTQSVERLVHVSSLVVYELLDVKNGAILDETTPYQRAPERMGPYTWAKTEAEKIIFAAHKSHGLPVTVVRPGMIIGPLGRVFFPHFGYRFQDKLFFVIGAGDLPLPLAYVDNVVDGICKAAIKDVAIGSAYNLVDDGTVTVSEYLRRFVQVTGKQARIVTMPYLVPYLATKGYELAAYFNLVRAGKTSAAQLKWKQKKVRFDNRKAKSELGWTSQVCLEEGLTRTFDWYAGGTGKSADLPSQECSAVPFNEGEA